MSQEKIKVLTLGDHPLAPSGVGIQTKLFIESLLDTGKYVVTSLAGAQKTSDFTPLKTEKYGEDWKIFPVEGYGSPEIVRSILRTERPDIVWFMTDPRYWAWLWQLEDEIRPNCPMVYYHVWDNYPPPLYNKKFYESNDAVVTISKLTSDVVSQVAPDVRQLRIPHTVDSETYTKLPDDEVAKFRAAHMGDDDKMIFFWNNRNARRKQTTTLLWWFKEFAEEVGEDNVSLLVHTDPKDPVGTDIELNLRHMGFNDGQIMISAMKYPPDRMALLYNMADCTINISDAEGFGLATLESLYCGTPIIVNMTGGLQEQVTDGENWFGIGIEPASTVVIGSQAVPYINEDRISKEDFLSAMRTFYNMKKEERDAMGEAGRQYVNENYNQKAVAEQWDKLMTDLYNNRGSWGNSKHRNWELLEVA